MPRKPRVQFPGALYHIMNRGDRREDIFLDDSDRQLFLKTLGEACLKTKFQVHAWCLMRKGVGQEWHVVKLESSGIQLFSRFRFGIFRLKDLL